MISRIEGELVGVENGRAELRCGHLTYLLLVPTANEEARRRNDHPDTAASVSSRQAAGRSTTSR